MSKKFTDFEISDETLSRRFWRKAISTNSKIAQREIHNEIFSKYQQRVMQENIEVCSFPACVRNEQLRKALLALTVKQRKVIELYYFQNMTQADIADYMQCAQSTVSEKLDCGMRKLMLILNTSK